MKEQNRVCLVVFFNCVILKSNTVIPPLSGTSSFAHSRLSDPYTYETATNRGCPDACPPHAHNKVTIHGVSTLNIQFIVITQYLLI